MEYKVIGPNGRIFSSAKTWTEALEKAVAISINMRVHFSVGATGNRLPFAQERGRTLRLARAFVESEWNEPGSMETRRLAFIYDVELRRTAKLFRAYNEPHQDDLFAHAQLRAQHPGISA